jgi:3',5'-cyclic AMP phosphodiesterase CpdA
MSDFSKPLEFTVITDAHYYSKKLGVDTKSYKKFNGKSQKLLKDSEEVITAAFSQIAQKSSEIVLFCGDSTCDGEYESHAEFIELLEALKKCGKRVFAITSTHDYRDEGITYKYTGEVREEIPSAKRSELFDMYRLFGPNEAISVYREGLSYIVELDENYCLFALNSDKDGTGRSGYTAECKAWVEENAKRFKSEGKRMIAITHHPLISPSPFYSLIGKNDMMGGHDEISEWLADLGISLVFSGHSHVHDISYIFSKNNNILYDVSTSALAGYPGYMRQVKIVDDSIIIKSEEITEPVNIKFNGNNLQEHFENQFFGMIRLTLQSAANDIPTFADNVTAISIPSLPIYKYGWLIKPFAKLLNKLTIGTVANWTKAETGLKKEDVKGIKDEKVVDFILDLVMHLYKGDAPYTPDTLQYRITVGLLNIIESLMNVLHINFGKLVKGYDNISDLIIPLLYNKGICDKDAVLPFKPSPADIDKLCNNKYSDTVKRSKKGPFIFAVLILAIIILIPLIPLIAIALGIGFAINSIKYNKEIRSLKNE